MSSNPAYEVELVSSELLLERWDEIAELLRTAFSDATFLEAGSTAECPARETWKAMHEPGGGDLAHAMALLTDGRIAGGLFGLPKDGPVGQTRCDVGWFFTDGTLSDTQRREIGDAVLQRAHEALARLGYEAVVTRMGTEEIAEFLSRRHRYLPAPFGDDADRWIRSLRNGPASLNSAKKRWKSDAGQYARYATTDIAKDEIILDLSMLFERASGPSAMTVQLGDGRHYRSTEGPFGLNHHCSPNGYICFEDLTYRALHDISEGAELSFHYCTTELEMANSFECLCGAPDCLGRVGGFAHMDEEDIEKIRPLLSPFLRSKLRPSGAGSAAS